MVGPVHAPSLSTAVWISALVASADVCPVTRHACFQNHDWHTSRRLTTLAVTSRGKHYLGFRLSPESDTQYMVARVAPRAWSTNAAQFNPLWAGAGYLPDRIPI